MTVFAPEGRRHDVLLVLVGVIVIILVGWALRATYVVTMPLAFAVVVAMLVQPIRRRVAGRLSDRWSWMGVAAAMLVVLLALALFAGAFWLVVEVVGGKIPQYADKLQSQWQAITTWALRNNLPVPEDLAQGGDLAGRIAGFATTVLRSAWQLVGFLVLIFFLVLLILLEIDAWRAKSRRALAHARTAAVLDSADTIAGQVRWYLLIRTILGLGAATLTGIWLLIMGVDFVLVWALLSFMFNYVPSVGSIIAGVLISLFALHQFGIVWALAVAAGLFVIEQLIGNYLDPRLQGRTLDISPLVVLLSVVFWGWVWGIAGALLAVPLTVAIVVASAHVPALRPIALMLARSADEQTLMARTHANRP